MKIIIYVNSGYFCASGGFETVYCRFANEFARRGHELCAVYNGRRDATFPLPIAPEVKLRNLRAFPPFFPLGGAAKIWREITRPTRKTPLARFFPDFFATLKTNCFHSKVDVLLKEFQPDVVVMFHPVHTRDFLARREQVDFATIQMAHTTPDFFIRRLMPLDELCATLNRCDVVQTLLPSFVAPLQAVCSTPVVSIPNAVPSFAESVDVDEREREGAPRVVYFARQEINKRQHLAIEAFAKIADACPDWTLHFYGDSQSAQYDKRLNVLIAQENLQNRVFLHPSTPNVKEELLKSDVVAFPSAFEGFSLALTEAQSLGLPVVGFADAPSVNELIVDGENGFLARDVDDFAQKLKTLIESKELRRELGAKAKKSVEKYEESKVWDAWEKLLRETVEKKRAKVAAPPSPLPPLLTAPSLRSNVGQ